jgi:hypothetical protein
MNKAPIGRPPKEPAEKLVEIIQFRLTAAERKRCEEAADRAGVKFSVWIRERLLRAANREVSKSKIDGD